MRLSRLSGLSCLLVTGHAFAQPPPGPMLEGPVNETQSVLPNLLSTSAGGTIDARTDFTLLSDEEITLFAINVHGQFISPTGLGGYAAIPFVYGSADDAGGGSDSESGIGNLELGGLYAIRSSPDTDILLRGGIALDTADEEDVFLILLGQLSPRLNDVYASGFATTWGRAQAQVRHASGNIRLGGMIGFDLPIDGLAADSEGFTGAFNAAASIGIQGPSVGFGIGFAMIKAITDNDTDDTTFSSINATVDFPVGATMRFFGTFGYPEPDENEFDAFAVGAGIRAGI